MGGSLFAMAHLLGRVVAGGLRRGSAPVRRMASGHGMSAEEELSQMKLYPGFRPSFFGSPGENKTWGDTKARWVIVEAYPLFAAIGLGCLVCFMHCMRHMFFSPDVMVTKSNRGNAMIENFKEGQNWKGNPFRSAGSLKKDPTDAFR